MPTKWEALYTPTAPKPMNTYSQAIRAGDYVFIKGQVSFDNRIDDMLLEPLEDAYEQAFRNVLAITGAAGGTSDDIIKIDIFVKDLNTCPLINRVMEKLFRKPYPARTCVGVDQIPRGGDMTLDAIVYLPQK